MHPTDPPVAHALLIGTVAIWAIFEIRQAQMRRPEADRADRGSRPALGLSYVIAALGAFFLRRYLPSATLVAGDATAWTGLALMWCGIGLRIWSFQTLGRYFTFTVQTSQDQPVISAGPYRVIRHPGYAGLLLAITGVGCIIGNWVSLLFLIIAGSSGLVYRITVEERALSRDLGGRYQAYAQSRKRLVPLIW